MSRKTIYSIIACLLCLLPSLSYTQSLTKYEYWFDDDFSGRVIKSISGIDKVVKASLNTDQLDNGVHKFSFRAKQSDGKYSAITSSLFLKRTAAQSSIVEYWFDDNFDQRDSMAISNTEEEQSLSFNLQDNTKYPMGFHKLNMRVTMEGEGESAVYSSGVLKLSAGTANQLEYWIDDDRSNIHTLTGNESSDHDGYIFISDLNLGNISPGHHRISFRARSNSGKTVSAITTAHVIVKSKYNDPTDLTVTEYSIAVDNGEPITYPVPDKKNIVNIPHTLDARGLKEGQSHRIDIKVYNSLGASVSIWDNFKVNSAEDPVITLYSQEENGYIHLLFNSIPNDVRYKIYRTKQNGSQVCIPTYNGHNYPNTNYHLDAPQAGTYSYEVEGTWSDFYGDEHTVRSNKVVLTTEGSTYSAGHGSIEGIIRLEGKHKAQLPHDLELDVSFSDGVKVRVQDNGTFYRGNIPLGTTLTMTIGDVVTDGVFSPRRYSFDVQTVTVTEEQPVVQVVFNGERNNDTEMVDDMGYSELVISSELRCTDTSFNLEVKNISGRTWTGSVYLKAIKCEDLDKYEEETGSQGGSTFSFVNFDSYFLLGSESISQLANGKTQEITINFDNIPINARDEDYYIFIVSKEMGRSRIQLLNTNVENVKNPKQWTLPATVWSEDYRPFVQAEADAYLKEIFDIMDIFKKIDGPFKYALDQAAYQLDLYDQENYGGDKIFGNLPEILQCFGEDLQNAIKDVDDVVQLIRDFKSFCDKAKELYDLMDLPNEDSYTVWNKAMKAAFDAYATWGGPLAGIYTLYLDATDKAVEHIEEYGNKLYEYYGGESFYNGITKFNLVVKKKNPILENKQFKAENIAKMIKSVTISCIAPNRMVRMYHPDPNPTGRELNLVPGDWIEKPSTLYGPYDHSPATDFFMEIVWWNFRVTRIPLAKDIVDIRGDANDAEITVTLQSGSNEWINMDNRIKIVTKIDELNE